MMEYTFRAIVLFNKSALARYEYVGYLGIHWWTMALLDAIPQTENSRGIWNKFT